MFVSPQFPLQSHLVEWGYLGERWGKETRREEEFWGGRTVFNMQVAAESGKLGTRGAAQASVGAVVGVSHPLGGRQGDHRDVTRGEALPTSARLSADLAAAGGSRSRDSAWILHKRSLRSVFCARAWNMLKIVFQKSTAVGPVREP